MSFFDLNNIAFSALNYPMSWLELVATAFGLIAVWLSAREHIANWGFGLVNVALSGVIFYKSSLYSDMFLQFYFFATNALGWWQWSRLAASANESLGNDVSTNEYLVKIDFMPRRQQLWLALGIVVSTVALGFFVKNLHSLYPSVFPNEAAFPYADTLVMVMSIFGNLLLMVKKIESWILWVLVDILAPVLYYQKGILLITFEYVVFLGLASFAFVNWLKIYRQTKMSE